MPAPRCNRYQTITPASRTTYRASGSVSPAPFTLNTPTPRLRQQCIQRPQPFSRSGRPYVSHTCLIPAMAPLHHGALPTPSRSPFIGLTSSPDHATTRTPFSTKLLVRPVSPLKSASPLSVYDR